MLAMSSVFILPVSGAVCMALLFALAENFRSGPCVSGEVGFKSITRLEVSTIMRFVEIIQGRDR